MANYKPRQIAMCCYQQLPFGSLVPFICISVLGPFVGEEASKLGYLYVFTLVHHENHKYVPQLLASIGNQVAEEF